MVCRCGDFELSSSLTTCFEEDAIVVQSLARVYKDPTVPVWHVLVERETDIKVECSNEILSSRIIPSDALDIATNQDGKKYKKA